jgi:hypothetical protein
MVFVFIAMFVGLWFEADRLISQPVGAMALFFVISLSIFGAIRTSTSTPMQRDLMFWPDRLEMNDVYLLGGRTSSVPYSALKEIRFSSFRTMKGIFKLTRITLAETDGSSCNTVHGDCPMYS